MITLLPGLVLALALQAPDDVTDLNERAKAALDAGRAADAVVLLESALDKQPGEPVLLRNLAYACYLRGKARLAAFDADGAAADYARAAATWPDETGYALNLASLQLRRYRLAEARDALDDLLQAHPTCAEGHLLMGDVLDLMDDRAGALAAYDRAIQDGEGTLVDTATRARDRVGRQQQVEQGYLTDETNSFIVRYPPDTSFQRLLDLLDRARAEVTNALDVRPSGRALVVLYPPDAFREVTGTHEWVGGLFDRRIRLPIGDPDADRDQIESAFRHEYTHLIVSELCPRCPTFLNEGLAQVVEHGRGEGIDRLVDWLDQHGLERADLPRLADLPDSFVTLTDRNEVSLGYLVSWAFVDHVVSQHGMASAVRWVRLVDREPVEEAYQAATGTALGHEEELFRQLVTSARR